jgi:ferredoxin
MLLLQANYVKGGMRTTAQKRGRIIKSKDLDKQLLKKVEELSGIKVSLCDQCGICSYNCPIGLDVRGHAWRGQPINDSHCLTCGECVARCPRGVLHFERTSLFDRSA